MNPGCSVQHYASERLFIRMQLSYLGFKPFLISDFRISRRVFNDPNTEKVTHV